MSGLLSQMTQSSQTRPEISARVRANPKTHFGREPAMVPPAPPLRLSP